MTIVFIGPDRGLGSALADRGATVSRVDGIGSGEALRAAGVEDAELLVLTDVGEATAVPVALELNPSLRVVVYAPDTLPEFVRGQVDLAVSPDVLEASVVAEELTDPA
ncbi:MAG: CTP synthetase [Halobacteriales archaeon]|nr:CTP synthetase [Halobacteriales archaeon]